MDHATVRELEAILETLPAERVRTVLDFARFLQAQEQNGHGDASPNGEQPYLDPAKDPLLEFIGGVSVEPFADRIDEELYGP